MYSTRKRRNDSSSCLAASFFERPAPEPYDWPPTLATAVKDFAWSGPSSLTAYSGTPRVSDAVSSCREVFQSRPAPRCAASASTGSNSLCTTSLATGRPCCRYTAPSRASSVSARMLALSRPPVTSSPRPSRTYEPSPVGPSRRATSASARMFTTEARSFASWPSGRSGCPEYSASVITSPSTASPRNSSRSFVGSPPFSYA